MNLKKEYVILAIVIIGLSLYLFTRSKDRTHFELPDLAPVEAKTIDRLVFQKGDAVIELIRKDDSWFVGEKAYRADNIKVRNMVQATADLKITALVSESGNYDRYDLTENKKTTVRAYAGTAVLRSFDIGRGAPTNRHSFVRLDGDPKVYHARGHIHETFDATVDELRDETVLEIEQAEVNALVIEKAGRQLAIVKKETPVQKESDAKETGAPKPVQQWQDQDGNAVDLAAVTSLLKEFKQLKCNDYMADDAKSTLKDPIWTITFTTADQQRHLSVFALPSDEAIEHPAVSSGSDYAFLLTKSRVEGFGKQLDKLLDGGQTQ
jgi:hypothetical protein